MRSLLLAVAALPAASAVFCPPVRAEEPLFLHIRPSEPLAGTVGTSGLDDDAQAARARREAVWARSDARARRAIASVCTGCLGPVPAAPPRRHDTTEIASHSDATTAETAGSGVPDPVGAAGAPATLLATAGEP